MASTQALVSLRLDRPRNSLFSRKNAVNSRMQALRLCARTNIQNARVKTARRCLTTTSASSHAPNSDGGPSKLPWFIDPSDKPIRPGSSQPERTQTPYQQQLAPLPPLPSELHSGSIIRELHSRLSTSPFLEPGTLLVSKPIPTDIGPPLPYRAPQGKRKRGGTYAGEGMLEADAGIWEWIVVAQVPCPTCHAIFVFLTSPYFSQVKEGTEGKGAIESVVRAVRQTVSANIAVVLHTI